MQLILLLPALIIATSLAVFAAPLFLYIAPFIIVGLAISYFHDEHQQAGQK